MDLSDANLAKADLSRIYRYGWGNSIATGSFLADDSLSGWVVAASVLTGIAALKIPRPFDINSLNENLQGIIYLLDTIVFLLCIAGVSRIIGAFLRFVKLVDADITEAKINYLDLSGARLHHAYLCDAYLGDEDDDDEWDDDYDD